MKKCYVLITALVTSFLLMLVLCVPSYAFTDANGHWANKYIEVLMQKGIVHGFPDGSFQPDSFMTLAQFIKTVVSASSAIKPAPPDSGLHWAKAYMDEALQRGLIDDSAYKDGASWDKPVSRLYMASVIHKTLLEIMNENDEDDVAFVKKELTDLNSCHSCRPHIEQCYAKGIIIGRPDRTFGGDEYMTRAEGCTVVALMIDKSLRKIPERTKEPKSYIKITPSDAKLMREKDPNVVFVDVRKPEELETGYISGSINLAYGIVTKADYEQALPDKSTPIVVFCASGIRSAKTAAQLAGWGYLNVYDMGKVTDYPDPLVVDNKKK